MAEVFYIKQNDTRPKLVVPLVDKFEEEGQVEIDLTLAKKVFAIMREKGKTGEPKFRKECALTDKPKGIVTYTWSAEDTDTAGTFELEFEIEWEDGGIETVPNKGYSEIVIEDDLG